MIAKCYINGMGCVSAQNTADGSFLSEIIPYENQVVLNVLKPQYQNYISPVAVRRMSSAVKNSVVASTLAINDAKCEKLDAIITGTGLGCIEDSEKFLRSILDNNEDYLTPTPFIQSTHNTVAGQIALERKCKAYNFTYVNASASFQSAMLDALMQVQNGQAASVLIGGVDEKAPHTMKLFQINEHFKSGEDTFDLISNQTEGHVCGEGATFFVLESEKKENTYCEVADLTFLNRLSDEGPKVFVKNFLEKNNLEAKDIDAVIFGNNGDINFDHLYYPVQELFSTANQWMYKHLFGEFMTASAIAVWIACQAFRSQNVPETLIQHEAKRPFQNILIYNQYRNRDHSLILLKNV